MANGFKNIGKAAKAAKKKQWRACSGVVSSGKKAGQIKKGYRPRRKGENTHCPVKASGSPTRAAKKRSPSKVRKICQKANGRLKKGYRYKNGKCLKTAGGKARKSLRGGSSKNKLFSCAGTKRGKKGRVALKKGFTWKKRSKGGCPTKIAGKTVRRKSKGRKYSVKAHTPRRHRHSFRVAGRSVKTGRASLRGLSRR